MIKPICKIKILGDFSPKTDKNASLGKSISVRIFDIHQFLYLHSCRFCFVTPAIPAYRLAGQVFWQRSPTDSRQIISGMSGAGSGSGQALLLLASDAHAGQVRTIRRRGEGRFREVGSHGLAATGFRIGICGPSGGCGASCRWIRTGPSSPSSVRGGRSRRCPSRCRCSPRSPTSGSRRRS